MDKAELVEILKSRLSTSETLPTFSEIKKEDPSLAYQIEINGGYLYFKNLCGYPCQQRKPPNYWNEWSNLEKEIQCLIVNEKFPTVEQIQANLGNGAYKAVLKFGGIATVGECMGYEVDSHLITSDGHHVQSSYEYILDEFLYHNGIEHEVGGKIPNSNCRYDFKVGDYYIEVWGYDYNKTKNKRNIQYNLKRNKKEKLYKENGLKLISVEGWHFRKSNKEIEESLNRLFDKLSIKSKPKKDFKVSNFVNHHKYWTHKNTLSELKTMIKNLGHFPSFDEIRSLKPSLAYGLSKNGGSEKFKKELGFKVKPKWTEENIIIELKRLIKDIGHFPTTGEFKSMKKTGLLSSITNTGGINKYRRILNCPILNKHETKKVD